MRQSSSKQKIAAVVVMMVGLAIVWPLSADTYHSKPDPKARGGISGTIKQDPKKPIKLQRVIALEPFEGKAYQGKLNAATGRFDFQGLPPGEYDLLIKAVGHVYEGVTLEQDPEQKPSKTELKQMCDEAGETWFTSEDYFNIKRIVRLTGDGKQARMLIVQTRTKYVVDPGANTIKGHIRRIDMVTMIKTYKVWQMQTSRHLLRQEVPFKSKDIKIAFTYSPDLGGLLVGEKVKNLGEIDLTKLTKVPTERYATADYVGK
jgi:hypothetical protein